MGAAAKLQAVGVLACSFARAGQMAHRDHANFLTIFFTKESLGTQGTRIVRCHNAGLNRAILSDKSIHFTLHLLDLRGCQRLPMAEIKPQPVVGIE